MDEGLNKEVSSLQSVLNIEVLLYNWQGGYSLLLYRTDVFSPEFTLYQITSVMWTPLIRTVPKVPLIARFLLT